MRLPSSHTDHTRHSRHAARFATTNPQVNALPPDFAATVGDVAGLVARLESLIAQRNQQVAAAMADFQADGVSDQYAHVERRWHLT